MDIAEGFGISRSRASTQSRWIRRIKKGILWQKKGVQEMPAKLYRVDLTDKEHIELERLTRQGKVSARKMKRAQILLKAAMDWRDEDIMAALDTSRSTVERTRRRFVEGGLAKALNEEARPGQRGKLNGRAETPWVALALKGAACKPTPWGER